MIRRRWAELRRDDADAGNAILEFIFVALIVMVPLVYLIATVASVQRTQLALTEAARDAGRAYATSDTADEAAARVRVAVRLALHDQGLPDDADVRFVASGDSCDKAAITPDLTPGAEFAVCVTRRADLPFVPSPLQGKGVTLHGEYVVHVDDFRSVSR